MRELTWQDRLTRAAAYWLERPGLALIASQPVLRRLFAVTSQIGVRMPLGTRMETLPDGSIRMIPPGVPPDAPLLFYIHGGGFTIGSPRTHRAMLAHIGAAAGLRVHLLAYPLAPEHPFPAAPQACLAAWRALCEAGEAPVAIGGDSAGGNLALLTAMAARDRGLPLPRALVLIAPIADLTGDIDARFAAAPGEYLIPPAWPRRIPKCYLAGHDPQDPAVSPLLGDLSGLPPTLIQAGSGEALAEDAKRLEAAMDAVTLELWDGLQHVWHLRAGFAPAATAACLRIGHWLRDRIG